MPWRAPATTPASVRPPAARWCSRPAGYAADPATHQRITGRPQYINMRTATAAAAGLEPRPRCERMRGLENYMANYGLVLTSDDYPAGLFARPQDFHRSARPGRSIVNAEGRRFGLKDASRASMPASSQRCPPDRRPALDRVRPGDPRCSAAAAAGLTAEDMRGAFDAHPWFKRAGSIAEPRAAISTAGLANR